MSQLPFFSKLAAFRVQETSAFKKGQEALDDLKEKYETSDHPMVHKVSGQEAVGSAKVSKCS